jgi:hypothetical protein
VSHFAAGGHFVDTTRLVELGLALYLTLFLVRKSFTCGPQLALIIIFTQSSGHILLGQSSNSNVSMLMSHALGGLLSYKVVAHSEVFWNRIDDFIFTLIVRILPGRIALPELPSLQGIEVAPLPLEKFILLFELKRGPPSRRTSYSHYLRKHTDAAVINIYAFR